MLNQTLAPGHYTIEIILSIDQKLIVKTDSYSDEKELDINYESQEFEFQFMDFKDLPNVT